MTLQRHEVPLPRLEVVDAYVGRIDALLAQLVQGHYPMAPLSAIEKLARAARLELQEAHQRAGREEHQQP